MAQKINKFCLEKRIMTLMRKDQLVKKHKETNGKKIIKKSKNNTIFSNMKLKSTNNLRKSQYQRKPQFQSNNDKT